jgi:hypothetical protein
MTAGRRWAWGIVLLLLACFPSVDEEAKIREGAERALAEARTAVSSAADSIHVLPPGSDTREAREVLDSDLESLRYDLAASARLLKSDRLVEASEAAIEVRREAEAIVLDVQRAARALPRTPMSDGEPAAPGGFAAP